MVHVAFKYKDSFCLPNIIRLFKLYKMVFIKVIFLFSLISMAQKIYLFY